MADVIDAVRDWAHDSPVLARFVVVAVLLIAANLVVRLTNRTLRRMYWRRMAEARPEHVAELQRNKRQQTILTLLESVIRYTVYGAAIFVGLSYVTAGASSVVFGASLVVVIVGFGLQRLLVDVVSGGLLLFEGHYAVGDFVHVHQVNASGIVEEVGLRTTTLRTLSGDRIVVLNGSIVTFTRYANGFRSFTLELLVRDIESSRHAIECVLARNVASPHQRFLIGPRLVDVTSLPDDDIARVELEAVVPPTMESLCEESLVAQLEVALGERLVGSVEVFNVSEPAFAAYRRSILVGAGGEG